MNFKVGDTVTLKDGLGFESFSVDTVRNWSKYNTKLEVVGLDDRWIQCKGPDFDGIYLENTSIILSFMPKFIQKYRGKNA